jgi:hypothetical protein
MEIPRSSQAPPLNLEDARQHRNSAYKWAISLIVSNDNGQNLAKALRQGMAYGVSDGSYKDDRGTSAFLLEGESGETNQIMRVNKIPGDPTEQSLYRAEVGEIEGILAIVDCLAQVHQLTLGHIKVGLNGEQAMLKSRGDWPLKPGQANLILICCKTSKPRLKNLPLPGPSSGSKATKTAKGNHWTNGLSSISFATIQPKHFGIKLPQPDLFHLINALEMKAGA